MSDSDLLPPPGPPATEAVTTPRPDERPTRPVAADATVDQARPTDGADPQATVAPEAGRPVGKAVPASVAGYEILGILGRGGMGVVYKARQLGLNRVVALKMILTGQHADDQEVARFRAEAEAVARIQHPNIVQIYEIGEEGGRPYFSLEYVDGGSLSAKINGEPQPPREAARVAQLLAGAMDCAHKAGVVHRDLKPANVLLTEDGTPKITDFGLAKRVQENAGQTRSGSILGTPGYMAPEQAEGKNSEVGPLADVYSLGAVLYEMLTGRMPFQAPTLLETLEQVRTREPVAPVVLQPGVPRDLETICLKCLQKDPRRRYESAAGLAEDLRRFLAQEPILARRVGWVERAWRWRRRNPWLAVLGAVIVVVVLGWAVSMSALAWGLKLQKDETDRNAALAVANEKKANDNAADARQKKDEAYASARVAVERMTQTFGKVQQRLDARVFAANATPELRALRNDVLDQLRDGMLGLTTDLENTGATRFATLAMYQEMGDVLRRLGKGGEAMQQYRKGCDLARKIADDQPDDDKARANLAFMLNKRGDMEREMDGDPEAARQDYETARSLQQEITDHPRSHDYSDADNERLTANYEIGLGKACLDLGDAAAARDHFDKAVALRKAWYEAPPHPVEARSWLSEAYLLRGEAADRLDDAKGARDSFDGALDICRDLAAKYPKDFSFQADVAEVVGALGDYQLRRKAPADADKSYRESLDNLRAAIGHFQNKLDYQALLARTDERLATAAALKDDPTEASKNYQEALRLRQKLVEIDPNNLSWQAAYLPTLAHCGKEADAAKQAADLTAQHPKSVPLLLAAARCCAAGAATAADDAAKQRYVGQAVGALRSAADAGCKDMGVWKTDADLAPIREEAAYRTLMDALAKR